MRTVGVAKHSFTAAADQIQKGPADESKWSLLKPATSLPCFRPIDFFGVSV
jgi:hypothetical protein